MTVRDSLIGLLAPQIGEARAIHLLNDFVVSATVGSRTSRADHRAEVLGEAIQAANSAYEQQELGDARSDYNEGVFDAVSALYRLLNGAGKGKGTGTTGGEPTPTVDFFQVGTAYRSEAGTFQCHAVTHHPMTGERRALGWVFRQVDGVHQWVVDQLDPDDFTLGGWAQTGGGR
ncbi:hypothetical protein [Streptomyces erythrochromogenes]|uniref:hypothetical protein n=1 Tax=Streptomyces erythrochromogenes TaxID=285574 RepID=UPI002258EE45|nr:hypothetical protein [Streptomyces erythrochromogenes]MCX5587607.1 hypothetical protein [Streptomyces erythrochromogenes]